MSKGIEQSDQDATVKGNSDDRKTMDPRPEEAIAEPHRDGRAGIATTDLVLRYADGTEAVKGVSLRVPEGEFFGFLGPNGAGKTTMIQVLATLLDPTEGDAIVNGHGVIEDRNAVRASIGYMAQETSVDEGLTARENLAFACDAYGVPRGERADRITDLLDLVDLADVSDTPAGKFSGGMKKRLDAATALVHDPDLVFLDEPTTGLDPEARNRLWNYFERINDEGTTVFLTTQYLEEADHLCDRLAVIRDGRIVARGSPDELKRLVGGTVLELDVADDADSATRVASVARESDDFGPDTTVETTGGTLRVKTERPEAHAVELLAAAREVGGPVAGLSIDEPTLDDVFMAITDGETDDLEGSA